MNGNPKIKNKHSKFAKERAELLVWLKGNREEILVLYCNAARMMQDLHEYIMNKPYECLSKNERGQQAVKDKANLIYFSRSTINIDKFCSDNGITRNVFTRGLKMDNEIDYPLFIVMTIKKWDEIKNK